VVKLGCSGEEGWRLAGRGGAPWWSMLGWRGLAMQHAATVWAQRRILGAACRGVAGTTAIRERRLHNTESESRDLFSSNMRWCE
jgi:hypothetical protein